MALVPLVLAVACGSGSSTPEAAPAPILGRVADTLPPGMSIMQLQGTHVEGPATTKHCHATLVGPHRIVTSAHCFIGFGPTQMTYMTAFDVLVRTQDVRFHPKTWSHGATAWDRVLDESDLHSAFDIAIINVEQAPVGFPIVKLWSPYEVADSALVGRTLQFGGHRPYTDLGPATGEQTIVRIESRADGGFLIFGSQSPSSLERGDSGGGATIVLTADLPSSRILNAGVPCEAPAPAVGQRVLVGINTAGYGADDIFVATYKEEIATWLAAYAFDTDGDGVCNAVDVCPSDYDPDQKNCNAFAESDPRWQSGVVLGDACDPTPCSRAWTETTEFREGPDQDDNLLTTHGRSIDDVIGIEPIIRPGDTAVTTPTIYFCLCRNADGTPVSDPSICEDAPYNCKRDPVHLDQRYWHSITVIPARETRGQIRVEHPSAWFGVTWDYQADFLDWLAQGFVSPIAPDRRFGPGTDLAGVLWIRSVTSVGASEHELTDECAYTPADDNCTIADSFVDMVAPDAKTIHTFHPSLPRYRPNPAWSGCPMCGIAETFMRGDIVSNPERFVTLDDSLRASRWTDAGAIDVTETFALGLRNALGSSASTFVSGSEPASVLRSAEPRAMMLSSDGTTILGSVTESRGVFGLDAQRIVARGMAPRTGHATAYRRATGSVYVAGGVAARGAVQADVFTYTGGRWSQVALRDATQAPVDAKSTTYSARDGRLWVIDGTARGSLVLRRIAPTTGAVETHERVAPLAGLTEVWTTALADGRVLVAGNTSRGHRLAVLDVQVARTGASTVSVVGTLDRAGTLAMGPAVTATRVSVARVSGTSVVPESIPLASLGVR